MGIAHERNGLDVKLTIVAQWLAVSGLPASLRVVEIYGHLCVKGGWQGVVLGGRCWVQRFTRQRFRSFSRPV